MPTPPDFIFADSQPGQDKQTNDTAPRFGGRVNPGDVVRFDIDGETTTVTPDSDGLWSYTAPQMDNGEHDFSVWTEDAAGDTSDSVDWHDVVEATPDDRVRDNARNDAWDRGGYEDWVRQNQQFMREHTQGGSGSGGGGGGGGGGQPLTPTPTTPVGGGRQPTGDPSSGQGSSGGGSGTATGVPPTPIGVEKGNAPSTYGVVGR